MPSGPNLNREQYDPVTNPTRFPSTVDTLINKTWAEKVIYHDTNSTGSAVYTDPISVGYCSGFTIFVNGTGDCTVQVSPNPNNNASFWVDVTTIEDGGLYSTQNYLPWVRVSVADGANLIIWIYRKIETF